MFSSEEIARYSSQIILPEIGAEGQQKLQKAKVLILGCGGLGSVVSLYLAAAGVGKITLVDKDKLELSNLQRQILYQTSEVGKEKVILASQRLKKKNPHIVIVPLVEKFDFLKYKKNTKKKFQDQDLFLDCSDSPDSKRALNSLSLFHNTPTVFASALGWSGSFFSLQPFQSACYDCVYPEKLPAVSCDELGVVGSLVGVIASMQALEATKILLEKGERHFNKMFFLDGLNFRSYNIKLQRKKNCLSCS